VIEAFHEAALAGCVQARRAASLLTGVEVALSAERPPALRVVAPAPPASGLLVSLRVAGHLPCTFALLLREESARGWAGRLLGHDTPPAALGEVERSALCELANVMGCALLGTAAERLHVTLIPEAPALRRGSLAELAGALAGAAVVLHAELSASARLDGTVLLLAPADEQLPRVASGA